MIEVAVGERFYYNGKYCEVVEAEPGHNKCSECDLSSAGRCDLVCSLVLREDDTEVCFKLVNDTDEAMDLAMRFGISAIPALYLVKDGELVDKSIGLISEEEIKNLIRKNI